MATPKKRWPIIVLFVLIFLIIAGGGIFYYFQYYKKGSPNLATSPSLSSSPTAVSSNAAVTWLTPQELSDLGLIKTGDSGISTAKYYKIADLADGGQLILADLGFDGPSLPMFYRFKKNAEGKYSYILNNSSEKETEILKRSLNANVSIDSITSYSEITLPSQTSVSNTTLKQTSYVGFFSTLTNTTLVGTTKWGKLYKFAAREGQAEEGGIIFAIKMVDSTFQEYIVWPDFMTDDEVAQITWSDGKVNTLKYTAEGYVGCGSGASTNVIFNTANLDSRLIEAGTTKQGSKVYTVAEADQIMKTAYDNYKIGRETNILTITQFTKQHPIFIYKDGLGDYVIYTGRDFAGLAECGKPVIYLYPEKEVKVSVKVTADISKSEPKYNNGWNVTAYPSGRLLVNGKEYSSLYWEGQGQEYPFINEGVIVPRNEVAATLQLQLSKLGLNSKESQEFLNFWLPKMPDTTYIRLTWFGTQMVNKLAPLAVTPQPDTMIRIFLDFEGLSTAYSIKAQNLTAPVRQGFTLVEWGGLLRK